MRDCDDREIDCGADDAGAETAEGGRDQRRDAGRRFGRRFEGAAAPLAHHSAVDLVVLRLDRCAARLAPNGDAAGSVARVLFRHDAIELQRFVCDARPFVRHREAPWGATMVNDRLWPHASVSCVETSAVPQCATGGIEALRFQRSPFAAARIAVRRRTTAPQRSDTPSPPGRTCAKRNGRSADGPPHRTRCRPCTPGPPR